MQIGGVEELEALVPLTDSVSPIWEQPICSEPRPVMTNKIEAINLRKNLRPDDTGNLIKENILSLNVRGHPAELTFYIDEVLNGIPINFGKTFHLRLLEEAADLSQKLHSLWTSIIE
jgi:hypothetical protein